MPEAVLDTGIKLVKNVGRLSVGAGSIRELPSHVDGWRRAAGSRGHDARAVMFVDEFFADKPAILARFGTDSRDCIEFVSTRHEPTTAGVDAAVANLRSRGFDEPAVVVGIGGGTTLDTAKAVANLLTNGGHAEDYQGWDLVKVSAVPKIGVPTISGTGAEATRTCVMTNAKTGLKLGMNSDYTVFDHVILDYELTTTVPRDQFFYTGMDAYIHCVESLAGSYRHALADAYSRETLRLCREVFQSDDMMSAPAREKLMMASYLGGCAIAATYVGIIHPLSAALSVVLGVHHCVANCIVMRAMRDFYPEAHDEFCAMASKQNVTVPSGIARDLSGDQYRALYDAAMIHEKPLTNALGPGFRSRLTLDTVTALFRRM